jgi:ATP-binding cassette subfamily F protein 3
MVDVRKEDKTIRPFSIPFGPSPAGVLLSIESFSIIKNHKPSTRKIKLELRKNRHLLLKGPNGIGKSTLLQSIADGSAKGARVTEGTTVGYYRQDFSNLDFDKTVYEELASVFERPNEEEIRKCAASFLIRDETIKSKIGTLSEGQKGLVAFARLVLMKPGLLILDEPTNHINFRHLPIIADALDKYEGAMILVSHVPDFVEKIRIDDTIDFGSK